PTAVIWRKRAPSASASRRPTLRRRWMSVPITVLIADDHPLLREGLVRILAMEQGIEVVGEAGSGPEAVSMVAELRPDVVLMDISMPGGGLTATREISRQFPEVGVIILTIHDDEQYLYE